MLEWWSSSVAFQCYVDAIELDANLRLSEGVGDEAYFVRL